MDMPAYVEPDEQMAFDVDALVARCIENGARSLLLDAHVIPPAFFDLSTRLAGELLHGLSKYSLRLAAVVPDLASRSPSFQHFVREANRGRQVRFLASREEAVAWLESLDPS
jgi:hypothetical protein